MSERLSVVRGGLALRGGEEVCAFLDGFGSRLPLPARSWASRLDLAHYGVPDAGLSCDEMSLPGQSRYLTHPIDAVTVWTVLGGGLAVERGRAGEWSSRSVPMLSPMGREFESRNEDLRVQAITLDPRLLAEVTGAEPLARELAFTGLHPVGSQEALLWQNTSRFISRELARATAIPRLLAGSWARLLAATALTVFPNTIQPRPVPSDSTDAHHDTFQRAKAFIDDNAHLDIGLTDIAASARVSVRAVQYAFRRHGDTTPLAYLRRVRLKYAHAELQASAPTTATVRDIAARWGFTHQGRFADAHRRAYGTTPVAVLREL
ncbi:helix-turn-helix transcriptional regulator [Streptomyces sp. NPDC047023]|uniref:helix-turn-helix transcriptional regulator n=1 Tax=Streptomyces sp. NPDC047023 TaxID=3155139 RepID=UPI0033D69A98